MARISLHGVPRGVNPACDKQMAFNHSECSLCFLSDRLSGRGEHKGSEMRLYCSTERDKAPPPLRRAERVIQSAGYDVWLIDLPVLEFIEKVRLLLVERRIVSACVIDRPPPAGKEGLFFEWHGKLLVGLDLTERILPAMDRWRRTQIYEDLSVAIFEPTDFHKSDFEPRDFQTPEFAERATQYRKLLEASESGQVVLSRESIRTSEALEQLFGQYADPKIGGAIALLSLSGAAASDGQEFVLKSPAALDLDVDLSPESLVAKPARDALELRCLGCSHISELERADGFITPIDEWSLMCSDTLEESPASYFVALELDASVDPTIAIKRGMVFEQKTLVGVQTLAVAKDIRTIVDSGEVKPLILPAYCLNSNLSAPHGSPMRPTPFVYRRADGSQQDVWRARTGQ